MFTGTTREMFEVFSSVTAGCQIQATSRGDGTRIVLDVSSRAMATSQIDPGDSYPFQPQWLTFVGWRILSNLRTPEAALTETKREPQSDRPYMISLVISTVTLRDGRLFGEYEYSDDMGKLTLGAELVPMGDPDFITFE